MASFLTGRKAYIISMIVLLGAIFLLIAARRSVRWSGISIDLKKLPMEVNGWEGEEMPLPERALSALGTSNVILRRYRKNSNSVRLYILESSGNRASFHPPQYCYVGGRTEMIERGTRTVSWPGKRIRAYRFIFLGPRGKSMVYY